MHIRVSRRRRNGLTYQYPQLVESYRRKSDGMPAHRLIMSLGHLSPTEVGNLKTALAASRKGKRVIIARAPSRNPTRPAANLRYLDIAVLQELWRQWELDALLDDLLPIGDAVVPASAVVQALAIQRCVAPGSKSLAERWYPRTALPELLGVAPEHFNNTRLHRVLDSLDQCGPELMAKLPRRYAARHGAFAALFLDVTDTWFVGHGPQLAQRAKTKEGHIRRKVGIVLLCNERGYPLRWEVIGGRESDKASMGRMVSCIAGLSWVGDAPLVCDRSMGNTAQIQQLLKAQLRFVTALVRAEFSAYTEDIPHQAFSDFVATPRKTPKQMREQIARAGTLAQRAGLQKVDDKLFVLDLGIIERPPDRGVRLRAVDGQHDDLDPVIEAVRLGRQVREAVAEATVDSLAAAGRRLGLAKSITCKYRRLANLAEDIQQAVVDGKAKGVSIGQLLALEKLTDLDAQQQAFERLVQKAAHHPSRGRVGSPQPPCTAQAQQAVPIRVRAVAYFNPEQFLEQRLGAQRRSAEIDAFVEALNQRLTAPRAKLTETKVLAEVERKLRQHELVEAYQVQVHRSTRDDGQPGHFMVALQRRAEEWTRRRRYDGFSLLVAHPEVHHSAVELCRLYRSKDIVEKDFETIKSVVRLRPIHHRLDAKVRAHVTICMLSLLLERTLGDRLGDAFTAGYALEELGPCHLNRYAGEQGSAYALTDLTQTQDAILRKLRLRSLADDGDNLERITPR
jgi:hypothetical protein